MNQIHEKIIQAVISKAERECPGALALVGIYGSVATGDAHKKSDLDLMILIDDERGFALATGMILEDCDVGYDLYCTTWESLRQDAEVHHAHIAKLMDCQIVYVGRTDAYENLCQLRVQAEQILCSETRCGRAEELQSRAKMLFADICLTEQLGKARVFAYYMIDDLVSALMLHNGRYFRYGTKRLFDELADLPDTEQLICKIKQIAQARGISQLRELCGQCLLLVQAQLQQNKVRKIPSADLAGTYEEMYSNWRNKVVKAAEDGDVFGSFANLCGLHGMLADLAAAYDISEQDVMREYDPDQLARNVEVFERNLSAYERVYEKAGIRVKCYKDVDAFVKEY